METQSLPNICGMIWKDRCGNSDVRKKVQCLEKDGPPTSQSTKTIGQCSYSDRTCFVRRRWYELQTDRLADWCGRRWQYLLSWGRCRYQVLSATLRELLHAADKDAEMQACAGLLLRQGTVLEEAMRIGRETGE
ncbi:hypothetical protein EVAR_3800_1 [Eumeta japonica]|uniref:Uncharacterized protein n=1 Tax=Eumeta variegata TaxID=151549 RepID=A0A4C1SSM2_EUMVA|nr:hypothetical protein EVAR_3800_1 [Eumeta japonica]